MTTDAFDKVALEYFIIDELDEIFKQKSSQVATEQIAEAVFERMSEEEMEFVSEAKKRLQNKGFVPNNGLPKIYRVYKMKIKNIPIY